MSKRAVLFAVFLSTAATIHLGASVPLGVYAVVDKVVMEPSAHSPYGASTTASDTARRSAGISTTAVRKRISGFAAASGRI
jgi:hypothetical protein